MNKLLPGPRGAVLQTLRYAWNPWSVLRTCQRRYGDPFTIPSVLGPVVFTGTPEGAKDILHAAEDTFDGFGMPAVGAILGQTSLMLAGGAAHRRMRKLHTPAFRPQRVRSFDTHILTAIERVISSLQPGAVITALDIGRAISLEVIVRVVFGGTEDAGAAYVRELLREMVASVSPWLLLMPALQQNALGFGPWARHRRAAAALDRYIREESARRRKDPGEDVLTQLLLAQDDEGRTMSEQELRDQLVTLLIAGYDTSAFALAWALYHIHKWPTVLTRLRDEIGNRSMTNDTEAIMRLPYLDAVVSEVLRLEPLAPEVLRTTVRPFVLRGHALPTGTAVALSVTLLHEDPNIFPEPASFKPQRFLDRSFSPHEYAPYGGGAFRCIGAGLATREMKLAVASFVSRVEMALNSERPIKPVRKHFLMGPDAPIEMTIIARNHL